MATTEELDLVIKTVGDTSGAQAVTQSLTQTQQAAQQTQQTLSSAQQGANAVMRAIMQQQGATLEHFQQAVESIKRSTGVEPTLKPQEFGIAAEQIVTSSKKAADATREVGLAARVTGSELGRFGAAALGTAAGLSAYQLAGEVVHKVFERLIVDATSLEHAQRNNTIVLGTQAQAYQDFARTVSDQAGVTEQSLLEAGRSAQQFGQQVGFGPERVQGLVALSTLLARIQGTDVGTTMTQLSAALNGNAQAAQALNLQLDASYVSYTQLGGATSDVFNLLDDSTRASLRYAAAMEQVGRMTATVPAPVDALEQAQGKLNAQWERFVEQNGPKVLGTLAGILDTTNKIIAANEKVATENPELFKAIWGVALPPGAQQAAEGLGRLTDPAEYQRAQQWISYFQDLGKPVQDAGNFLRDLDQPLRDVGVNLDFLTASAERAKAALDALRGPGGGPFLGQGQAAREAVEDARRVQQEALQAQLSGPQAVLAASQANLISAAEALVAYQRERVDLTADEARIRLDMLPTTERMVYLQNLANQAQIEATQRALPASRALQDLQNAIKEQQLIAEDINVPMDQRMAARLEAIRLTRGLTTAERGAFEAEVSTLPAQRQAQDIGLAAQATTLQLAQAIMPDQFRIDQLTYLGQIAEAVRASALRTNEISINEIRVDLAGAGINPDDEERVAAYVGDTVAKAIHAARLAAERGANSQLVGGG
jgi:hypothetical protein